jgi:cation transport regulator ChaC
LSVWIFGYGSLIWRPGFSYRARRVAFIEGFERRLDQGSPDHRGTPERLGRVATLVRAEGARCGGVVFELPEPERDAILEALDHREKGGYERLVVSARLDGPEASEAGEVTAITWVASPETPYHLGPTLLEAMLAQIEAASGPSGSNIEYVLRLAEALREHRIADPHVVEVAEALLLRLEAAGARGAA